MIGPIRAALLIALIQTPHRFRTKRPLWKYSGFAIETQCCLLQTNWRTSKKVAMFLKSSPSPRVLGLMCMPIVPPTPGREQRIGQDAAENERNSNQELQNCIHHGFLQGTD